MRFPWLCAVVLVVRVAAHGPVEEMADAARNFLAALSEDQRAITRFEFGADERENWHFVPKERKGITLGALKPAQRHLAQALLSSGLSSRGYVKATTIMSLEQILQELEGPNRRFPRDPELYHVSIFGTPDAKGTWGWRVEGHHLSVNMTLVEGRFAAGTPSFMGSNPGRVKAGAHAGLRVLGAEEDLARELVLLLDADQRKVAIISADAPDDVLTLAARKAVLAETNGLPVGRMDAAQRALVDRLLGEYVGRLRPELAEQDLAKITAAGRERILFAWAGGTAPGQRHYYRLHGPTFLLEYDNTQNDANHVHAVWRDFENDFGRDLLREHYARDHKK
jgi:hypothetical protein